MNLSSVAEVEKLSEAEFTNYPDSAGISTFEFLKYFTVKYPGGIVVKKKNHIV